MEAEEQLTLMMSELDELRQTATNGRPRRLVSQRSMTGGLGGGGGQAGALSRAISMRGSIREGKDGRASEAGSLFGGGGGGGGGGDDGKTAGGGVGRSDRQELTLLTIKMWAVAVFKLAPVALLGVLSIPVFLWAWVFPATSSDAGSRLVSSLLASGMASLCAVGLWGALADRRGPLSAYGAIAPWTAAAAVLYLYTNTGGFAKAAKACDEDGVLRSLPTLLFGGTAATQEEGFADPGALLEDPICNEILLDAALRLGLGAVALFLLSWAAYTVAIKLEDNLINETISLLPSRVRAMMAQAGVTGAGDAGARAALASVREAARASQVVAGGMAAGLRASQGGGSFRGSWRAGSTAEKGNALGMLASRVSRQATSQREYGGGMELALPSAAPSTGGGAGAGLFSRLSFRRGGDANAVAPLHDDSTSDDDDGGLMLPGTVGTGAARRSERSASEMREKGARVSMRAADFALPDLAEGEEEEARASLREGTTTALASPEASAAPKAPEDVETLPPAPPPLPGEMP